MRNLAYSKVEESLQNLMMALAEIDVHLLKITLDKDLMMDEPLGCVLNTFFGWGGRVKIETEKHEEDKCI
jgi:hypothetical protein